MVRRTACALSIAFGCLFAANAARAELYQVPFKGEDFSDNERGYWHRKLHSESGVQKYGYDLDVKRYVDQKWWSTTGNGDKNSDWYIYGKPVYAMRAGKVIACWRNSPENPKMGSGAGKWNDELTKYANGGSRIYGGGNGFWIEHADGSRAEYAHFKPGTVPTALCPHNDALMPSVIASPDVTDAWLYIRVDAAQQKTVSAGQFLGNAGNVGTSTNPHLHIHVENGGVADATKSGGSPVQISFKSGLFIDFSNSSGPYVEWKSFAGKPIPPGPILFWPSRSLVAETSRHGFDAAKFGAFSQHLADSGFWPEWIDAYSVGGKSFLNWVWRPAAGGWLMYFLVDATKYQQVFSDAKAAKFAPVFVESSLAGGQPRYTAIFVKNKPGKYRAKHGLTSAQHDSEMDAAKAESLVPVNVSVISVGGQRFYTVLYRSGSIGSWAVRSQVPEAGYQKEYDDQKNAGRKPLYLDAYMHGGTPYISAIFGHVSTSARKDKHAMSAADYQTESNSAIKAGMLTRTVTSFDGAQSQHRFAACWWK